MKNKKDISIVFILLSFLFILLISGVLLGLVINTVYGKFSFRLFKIAFINSFFLSLGIILNILITKLLIDKIKKVYIVLLNIFLILGISFIGLIYVFFSEMFFFLYETNTVNSYLLINLLFTISISLITMGNLMYQSSLSEKEKVIDEEKHLREQMEQKLYTSKINPHFLFNSLNLMISLLKEPKKAEKALIYLSELLRYTLEASEKEEIPVKEEIINVEKYLFIQKLRFEERLGYVIICNDNFLIPPLILQPLVENSIKHNIRDVKKLEIKIEVQTEKNSATIKVIDSNMRLTPDMIGKGTGLDTTKKRVELAGGKFIISNGGIIIIFGL